jgi:hypothetical protein
MDDLVTGTPPSGAEELLKESFSVDAVLIPVGSLRKVGMKRGLSLWSSSLTGDEVNARLKYLTLKVANFDMELVDVYKVSGRELPDVGERDLQSTIGLHLTAVRKPSVCNRM